MKAFDIFMFLIAFMFAANILVVSGFLNSPYNDDGTPCTSNCGVDVYYGDDIQNVISKFTSFTPTPGEELSYPELAISAFGLLIRTLVIMVFVLLYATILMPFFLAQLGVPLVVNTAISTLTTISAVIGYNQYKARSTLLGTE